MRRLLCHLLAVLGFLLIPGTAIAHQSSFSYSSIALAEDGKSADFEIRLSTRDLFEALSLGENRDATDAEIIAGGETLSSYVFERVRLGANQPSCEFSAQEVGVAVQGERLAQITGSLRCPQVIGVLNLEYDLFFDLDPRHEGLLRVADSLVRLDQDEREASFETGHEPTSAVLGFLVSGFHHVLYGLDHILFLVALLLVVCLRQEDRVVLARGLGPSLRRTGGIVTAFTLGHSLTLILAALGWIELSSRLVESMIAASIVYVAVENVLRPDPPRRYLITFAFGLMHGLGFAAMLRPLLPPGDTILPLLVFNIGVEAGQLAIVAVCLPPLYGVLRFLSAASYRRYLLPTGGLALSALGLVWLAERALEIELLGI